MVKKKFVKVKKEKAEKVRKKLEEENSLDRKYSAFKESDEVYFPVKKETSGEEVVEREVEKKDKKPKSLKEALEGKLSEEEVRNLVTSFDIIGDIAVIEVPEELEDKEELIGKAMMKVHPSVSTVCKRESKTLGKYRIRPVKVIAGEEKTKAIHKENNVRIQVDLNKMYFNPRLSNERKIVSSKVEEGEEIGYLFAGAGPFALVIAQNNPEVKITAVELNPDAYEYLKENILLNKFSGTIKPIQMDVMDLEGFDFDRVIMPLPLTSEDFLKAVLKNVHEGSVIHYYSLGEKPNYFEQPLKELEKEITEFEVLDKREVLSYAPGKKEVCVDVEIIKK